MANLRWEGKDFRNPQSSSGATADLISHSGKLQQGYFHGSLTQGLVAYYPMEAGSGSTLNDSTEIGHDGSINGASWNSGKVGDYCLSFDGASDYVDLGHFMDAPLRISISCWVYLNEKNTGTRQTFLYKGGSNDDSIGFWEDSGTLELYVDDAETSSGTTLSGINPSTGAWYHLAATYNGSNSKTSFYIDGVEVASSSSITGKLTSNNNIWALGRRGNEDIRYLNGRIDDARIYQRTLSEPEVKALSSISNSSKVSPGDTLQ